MQKRGHVTYGRNLRMHSSGAIYYNANFVRGGRVRGDPSSQLGTPIKVKPHVRAFLEWAWHQDVDVTDMEIGSRHQVNQVFCSALPVAYGLHPAALWEPFARLVLEAAYEATLRCAWITASAGGSNRVLLTGLGGGAFGNPSDWIFDALDHALDCVKGTALEVHLVCYGHVPEHFRRFVQ